MRGLWLGDIGDMERANRKEGRIIACRAQEFLVKLYTYKEKSAPFLHGGVSIMFAVKEKHTIKDYKLLPEGAPYQLIEGELVMTPSPTTFHQIILGNLNEKIRAFVKEKDAGLVLFAPIDVYLDDENVFQPDIVFISKQRQDVVKDDGIHGAPDMIIEILSPSTAYYDIKKKYKIYEKFGVKEYWIVDPEMKSVELFSLTEQGKFLLSAGLSEQGTVKSGILSGFEITLEDIFRA
jgi:Uma2 family endonuclease